MSEEMSYARAGVDIDTADAAKAEMATSLVTADTRVLNRIGAFATLFEAKFLGIEEPVLVLKAEEPGSKQLLSFQYGRIRDICFDLINHLINDIAVMGAKPEAVLDIILCGQLEKGVVVQIVDAIAQACKDQGCSLVGGETSEQPGVLPRGTYMLNASVVGVVEKRKIIDGSRIEVGDRIVALASNGLHTNGYSLVRKLLEERPGLIDERVGDESFLDAILRPHRCYYQALRGLFDLPEFHGLAHITGGGIEGNLNRILPEGTSACIDAGRIRILPVFDIIRRYGNVPNADMLRTFNMGVGIALVAHPSAVEKVMQHLAAEGCESYEIGEVGPGNRTVEFRGNLDYGV